MTRIQHYRGESRRRGVVAVILRENRFLVIRRSQFVVAPGLICFPGGGLEKGESEPEALVREMQEELALAVTPMRRIWHSITPSGTRLGWWSASIPADMHPVPNPEEVEEFMWLDGNELHRTAGTLPSLPQFLEAWRSGKIPLSSPLDQRPLRSDGESQ